MSSQDLQVRSLSEALKGFMIDVVVCGSIGAVESVRFIRSLRRLGAEVRPILTTGGAQFITPMSLSWASSNHTIMDFSGEASHIASADACIIAPASANMFAKLAHGITDSPASALAASYLGLKKPVIAVANMHDSLSDSPIVAENMAKVGRFVELMSPRNEEGKQKFPDPAVLADEVAHSLNKSRRTKQNSILVTMGTTRGYIDEVRYVSNYSTGKLGSLIAEDLYRYGFDTEVVAGPSQFLPKTATHLHKVVTTEEMLDAVVKTCANPLLAQVFAASVLDYTPKNKQNGKVASGRKDLSVEFIPTPKIIAAAEPSPKIKIACKLETDFTDQKARDIALDYMNKYRLSFLVLNALKDVDAVRHKACLYDRESLNGSPVVANSKEEVTALVVEHIMSQLV